MSEHYNVAQYLKSLSKYMCIMHHDKHVHVHTQQKYTLIGSSTFRSIVSMSS